MLWPRAAGKFICENASNVKLSSEGIKKTAEAVHLAVEEGILDLRSFKQNEVLPLDKGLSQEQLANWVFLVDALNFSFWTPNGKPKFEVSHKGQTKTGYMAMVLSINRAVDEGRPMFDPNYYSKLSYEEICKIFRSDTPSNMPLLEERVQVMHAIGEKLQSSFNGSFVTVLNKANNSALKLVEIVTDEFPCFSDTAVFKECEVAFFKRAQILAADIWMLYRGEGFGAFDDIDKLTMFPDYRVPQTLCYFGALKYSDQLLQKLKGQHMYKCGEEDEVEIRGCSIHATELIVEYANKLLKSTGLKTVNSIEVDYFLWDYRVENAEELEKIPYHRVRCIFY